MKINYQDYFDDDDDDFYEDENYRGGKIRKFKDVDRASVGNNKTKKAIRRQRQQRQKQKQNEERVQEEEY